MMAKVRLGFVGALLVLGACSSGTGGEQKPGSSLPTGAVPVALGTGGEVLAPVTAAGPAGEQLTLYPGTRVAILAGGGASAPASGARVHVGLAVPARSVPLPAGITRQQQVRVVVSVDGAEVDAAFWTTTAGAADHGARLVLPVSGTVTAGTLGLLFDVSSGTTAVRVDTMTIDPVTASSATASLATLAPSGGGVRVTATGSASGQMNGGVPGSGTFGGGTAQPPAAPPSIPAGLAWSRFAVPDFGCVGDGGVQICGPAAVDRVSVLELSTSEILGICMFGASDRATTGVLPPGYQFWCERASDGAGGWIITVSSSQSNLPAIDAHLVRASDRMPMLDAYLASQDGLVHLPTGETLADPYARADLKFAGHKPLRFRSSQDRDYAWVRRHTYEQLVSAGYETALRWYRKTSPRGFEAEVVVYDTLDARSKLEQEVVLPEGSWNLVAAETRGNRGTYENAARLEHLDVDEVAGVLRLSGRFGVTSCQNVAVRFGTARLTPTSCSDVEIRAPLPASGSAQVAVEIAGGATNVIPLTEWKVHWDATELQQNAFGAVGTLSYALRFDVAFRADVHDLKVAQGTPGRRSRVDFVCERDGRANAEVSGFATRTFPGVTEEQTLSGTGTTTNRIAALDILNAAGDFLVCEGYVDLDQRRVVWAVRGSVSGPTSTLVTTVQLAGGSSETSTQVQDLAVSKGTWFDPALTDTAPWPAQSTPYAAAWQISLDGALGLPAGGHSTTYMNVTQETKHLAATATDAP